MLILAKEPVNADSPIICPSTNSNVVEYSLDVKSLTILLLANGISTITSLLLRTSLTTGEYPNDGILIIFSSTDDVQLLSSDIFNL